MKSLSPASVLRGKANILSEGVAMSNISFTQPNCNLEGNLEAPRDSLCFLLYVLRL